MSDLLARALPGLLTRSCQQCFATSILPSLYRTSLHIQHTYKRRYTSCSQAGVSENTMTALLSSSLSSMPHLLTKAREHEPRVARPLFHLAPSKPRGWINDPNGPLLHKGTYHLFWQNVPGSAEWSWGLGWGHATSKDLVQWKQLPVALEPTPDSLDQHGCFSGCATVDVNGVPSILYAGVVRQTPPAHTKESQLIAVAADPDDPELRDWVKLPGPFLPQPSPSMDLTGWRDPFVLEKPSSNGNNGDEDHNPWWYVMIGAGIRDTCGTALVYRSKDLKEGWEYVGPLCESADSHMWECPIMSQLTNVSPYIHSGSNGYISNGCSSNGITPYSNSIRNGYTNGHSNGSLIQRHMLCVSPDYCVNVPLYWLGDYAAGKFDMKNADEPYPLDLGDILYAPNLLTDKNGRTVMWAWMQEKPTLRPTGTYDASCCLCVPRVLYLSADGRTLLQEPLPELAELRQQHSAWHLGAAAAATPSSLTDLYSSVGRVMLQPGVPLQLAGTCNSSHIDMEVTVAKGDADSFVLLMQPFDGLPGAAGAGVAYCWKTNTLQVIHSTELAVLELYAAKPIEPPVYKKLPAPSAEEEAAARAAAATTGHPARCGGKLYDTSNSDAMAVKLRILIDGSCIEVFTSTGQALGTRVYRGDEAPLDFNPAAAAATTAAAEAVLGASYTSSNGAIELVSFGPGAAELVSASAWCMNSMWMQDAALQQQQAVEAAAPAVAVATAQVLQGIVAAEAAAAAAAAVAMPLVLPVGDLILEPTSPAVVPESVSVEAM